MVLVLYSNYTYSEYLQLNVHCVQNKGECGGQNFYQVPNLAFF